MIDDIDDDELILNLLRADDRKAPELLYKYHYKSVLNYVSAFTQSKDDAQDIVQELFIVIWEKRHTLNLIRPIRGYLISAAHNRVLNYIRNRERKNRMLGASINLSAINKVTSSPYHDLEASELAQIIKQAVSLLPLKQRQTFLISRTQGMTYSQIASHFNVSTKAVEKNMSKALNLLRLYLKDYIKILILLTGPSCSEYFYLF